MDALPESDFAAKLLAEGLPSGQDIFYRVRFQDLNDVNAVSEPVVGRFRTAPAGRRDVSFVWSGDTAGQGWGIDPSAWRHDDLRDDAAAPARFLHPFAATPSTPTAHRRPR